MKLKSLSTKITAIVTVALFITFGALLAVFAVLSAKMTDMPRLVIIMAGLTSLALIIVAAVVSLAISRAIKPIKVLAAAVEGIAGGVLDVQVENYSQDEIGALSKAFVEMSATLKVIIQDLGYLLSEIGGGNFAAKTRHAEKYVGEYQKVLEAVTAIAHNLGHTLFEISAASQQVSTGAGQVSGAAQSLSQGATEQASSIEELSASISEISERIKINAQNAALVRDKATENGEDLTEGTSQMNIMVDAMREISDKADEISKIIRIVDDIAFQTNILALNAAVEAARAGEAGKGFAVVADEVRNLAAKSAEAASNTSGLIEQTIAAVNNSFSIANKTTESISYSAGIAISAIELLDGIATASQEQAEAIAQINQGVSQIAVVVQSNAATAEENAATSEELSGQAEMLGSLISRFNLSGFAGKRPPEEYSSVSSAGKPVPSSPVLDEKY